MLSRTFVFLVILLIAVFIMPSQIKAENCSDPFSSFECWKKAREAGVDTRALAVAEAEMGQENVIEKDINQEKEADSVQTPDNLKDVLSPVSGFSKQEILLILLYSFSVTWGIGLLVPTLIRFAIVKKPLTKRKSFIISFSVLTFQLLAIIIQNPNSETKGLSLFIIAYLSYLILRKGGKKENLENKQEKIYCKFCGRKLNQSDCDKCSRKQKFNFWTYVKNKEKGKLLNGVRLFFVLGFFMFQGEPTLIGRIALALMSLIWIEVIIFPIYSLTYLYRYKIKTNWK